MYREGVRALHPRREGQGRVGGENNARLLIGQVAAGLIRCRRRFSERISTYAAQFRE